MLLAIALALFLAQGIGALLLYKAEHERIEGALVHSAAFRLGMAVRGESAQGSIPAIDGFTPGRGSRRVIITPDPPGQANDRREPDEESELRRILTEQEVPVAETLVVHRPVGSDPIAQDLLSRRDRRFRGPPPSEIMVAAVRVAGQDGWLVARVFVPTTERFMLRTLFGQTLFIYAVLVGAMWLMLRRITRPLAALTTRLERFAETRDSAGQLAPQGPDDIARLIAAHNAMEARIVALIDEKDVMLGAIGHDLKTPLAALRVRIETVEDETERQRMATTIEDITRTLDDILSLARVGRPSDPVETTELGALVASVVEEYEDMGEPVELDATQRLVLPLRSTWIRRALRNLIGNALRYGGQARVSLVREGDSAVIRIEDDGPGIPEDQICHMLEPFTRGDPSRNSETGGAGLGLTLARAIAEQHGGTLALANRRGRAPAASGIIATVRLPL
ncbi:HAMP domain-containing protein [Novosphingobium piscinae]|uniref:histidine kinase n=2 Tax=Novosphingobium piscinae TaxID=1507448 RepID=A0A7X1KR22_9SPHN|nr:ATP-binding protein [Novosphingobium piscinae]MBC2670272.1 HAMP domain-containing protein [Novosphingobium piscinae]